MKSFELIMKAGLIPSLRASITPDKINQIEALVKLAIKKGAKRIGIGSVIPTGKGKINKKLLMDKKQKEDFLKQIAKCKNKYPEIDVTTEDPLKFALNNCPWSFGDFNILEEGFYGGCSAGISGFNINSEGIITPCAVLLKDIVNLGEVEINEAKKIYVDSDIIKNLFKRNLNGKCKDCKLKRLCGGCRAVAEGIGGDYLGDDVTCFYKN